MDSDLRGVTVGNNFSPKQLEAIELFATGEHTCSAIAAKIEVTPGTISSWRKNPQFIDAIIDAARGILKEAIPSLYKLGLKSALDGDLGYFKTIIEHIDKLEEHRALKSSRTITFTWEKDADKDTIPTP